MRPNNKKIRLAVLLSCIGAIILFIIIGIIGIFYECRMLQKDAQRQFDVIKTLLDENIDNNQEITENYDELNINTMKTLALYFRNAGDKVYTLSTMEEIRQMLEVNNVLISDYNYNVLVSANKNTIDLKDLRENSKIEYDENGSETEFSFLAEDKSVRKVYSLGIDKEHVLVIEDDAEFLKGSLLASGSLTNAINTIRIGEDGFVSAVDEQGVYKYYPDSNFIGKNMSVHGFLKSKLPDKENTTRILVGKDYMATAIKIGDTYYLCNMSIDEIAANTLKPIVVAGFLFLAFAVMLILYSVFLYEEFRDRSSKLELTPGLHHFSPLGKKLLPVLVIWCIVNFFCCVYTQSIISLSSLSVINNIAVESTNNIIADKQDRVDLLRAEYDNIYLEKCRVATYIIEHTPEEMISYEFMIRLKNNLGVDSINIIDRTGVVTASDSRVWGYKLSNDKSDQSYQFRKLLDGTYSEYVQEARISDSGKLTQYIGVARLDENHLAQGAVQIAVEPKRLDKAIKNNSLRDVLSTIRISNGGFAFAINKDTNTFEYYPEEYLIGEDVFRYGVTEKCLKSDYTDFININGKKLYCSSTISEDGSSILYMAVPADFVALSRLPVAIATSIFGFIWMIVIWIFMSLYKVVKTPDGELKHMMQPISELPEPNNVRLKERHHKWTKLNAGLKIRELIRALVTIMAVFVLLVNLFAGYILDSDSIIHYIIKGNWEKGINIFSVTKSIFTILMIQTIAVLIKQFLSWMAENLNPRGKTVCKISANFTEFAAILGSIFYVLSMIGINTATLMTSAGILTLVVGMGANSLISDLLEGLFIVFEGNIQVGDIVYVENYLCTVEEIGIRTTKFRDMNGNTLIISNRNITKILNRSRQETLVVIIMSVGYEADLIEIETILNEELPLLKDRIPGILVGPWYGYVEEFDDSSIGIRVECKCDEKNRLGIERRLRKELKILFDKNNINIPFNQLVIHEADKADIKE